MRNGLYQTYLSDETTEIIETVLLAALKKNNSETLDEVTLRHNSKALYQRFFYPFAEDLITGVAFLCQKFATSTDQKAKFFDLLTELAKVKDYRAFEKNVIEKEFVQNASRRLKRNTTEYNRLRREAARRVEADPSLKAEMNTYVKKLDAEYERRAERDSQSNPFTQREIIPILYNMWNTLHKPENCLSDKKRAVENIQDIYKPPNGITWSDSDYLTFFTALSTAFYQHMGALLVNMEHDIREEGRAHRRRSRRARRHKRSETTTAQSIFIEIDDEKPGDEKDGGNTATIEATTTDDSANEEWEVEQEIEQEGWCGMLKRAFSCCSSAPSR